VCGDGKIVKIVGQYVVARTVLIVGTEEAVVEPFVCRERLWIKGRSSRYKHGEEWEINTSRWLSHSKQETHAIHTSCALYMVLDGCMFIQLGKIWRYRVVFWSNN